MATHTISYYLYVNVHPFTSNVRTDITQYVHDVSKLRFFIDYDKPNSLWNGGSLRLTLRNWENVLFDDTVYPPTTGVIPLVSRELYLQVEVDSVRFWVGYANKPMDFNDYRGKMLVMNFDNLFNKAVESTNIVGDYQVNTSSGAVTKTGYGYDNINLERLLDHLAFDRLQIMATSYDVRYDDYSQTTSKLYDFGDLLFRSGYKREEINDKSVSEFIKELGTMFSAFPMVSYPSGVPTFYFKDRLSVASERTIANTELRGQIKKITNFEQDKPMSFGTTITFPGGKSLSNYMGTFENDLSKFYYWALVNTNASAAATTLILKNMYGGDFYSSMNVIPKGLKFSLFADVDDFHQGVYVVKNAEPFVGLNLSSPSATTIDIYPALTDDILAESKVVFDWPIQELLRNVALVSKPKKRSSKRIITSSYERHTLRRRFVEKPRIDVDPGGFVQDIPVLAQCIYCEYDLGKFYTHDGSAFKVVNMDDVGQAFATHSTTADDYMDGVFLLPSNIDITNGITDMGMELQTHTQPTKFFWKLSVDGPHLINARQISSEILLLQEKIIDKRFNLKDGDDSDTVNLANPDTLHDFFITHASAEVDSAFMVFYTVDRTSSDSVYMRLGTYDADDTTPLNLAGSVTTTFALTNGDNPRQIYVHQFDIDHYIIYVACLGAQIIKKFHQGGAWVDIVSSAGSSTAIADGVTGTAVDQTDYTSVWKTQTQAFLDTKGWPFYSHVATTAASASTKQKDTFPIDDIFEQYCKIRVKINNETFEYVCTNSTRSTQINGIMNKINNTHSNNLAVTASNSVGTTLVLEADANDVPFIWSLEIECWQGQVWFMYEDPVGGTSTLYNLDEFEGTIDASMSQTSVSAANYLFCQKENNKLANLSDKPLALWGTMKRTVQFDLDEIVTDVRLGSGITIAKELLAFNDDADDGIYNIGEMEVDLMGQKTTIIAHENNTVT